MVFKADARCKQVKSVHRMRKGIVVVVERRFGSKDGCGRMFASSLPLGSVQLDITAVVAVDNLEVTGNG